MVWASVAIGFAFPIALLSRLDDIGKRYQVEADKLIGALDSSQFSNCVMYYSGLENIRPFWLRSVPFSPFLDSELRARGVVVVTEWHPVEQQNAKIPTHLLELALGQVCTVTFLPGATDGLQFTLDETHR